MSLRQKKIIFLIMALFVNIFFSSFVFAANSVPQFFEKKTATKYVVKNNPPSKKIHKNTQTINYRTVHAYNGSVWAGAGFLFVNPKLEYYIDNPTMDYQIGVAKSFWNFTPYTFFYLGLIADFAYSKRHRISSTDNDAFYYFSNEQLVIGYEQNLGTSYLSAFAEAGGVFQQRYFAIRNLNTAILTDYLFSTGFGGTFNAGVNLKFAGDRDVSYFFRLGMNLMIGPTDNKVLNFNNESVNVNQLSYSPFATFGVRI